jgi:hypothetical protein
MKTLVLLAAAWAPIALQAQSQQCVLENATLSGSYVTKATGFSGGSPFAVVGVSTYDGKGNFQFTATASANGTIFRGTGPGTYTVNRDCTGKQTFGPDLAHYDFVVSPDGRKITYIQTDAGAVVTVTSVRLEH